MKFAVIFAVYVAIVVAAPQDDPRQAETIAYHFQNDGTEGFEYKVKTSNGISLDETGLYKKTDDENGLPVVVTGSYSWKAPEGPVYTVQYNADKNGYRPVVTHDP